MEKGVERNEERNRKAYRKSVKLLTIDTSLQSTESFFYSFYILTSYLSFKIVKCRKSVKLYLIKRLVQQEGSQGVVLESNTRTSHYPNSAAGCRRTASLSHTIHLGLLLVHLAPHIWHRTLGTAHLAPHIWHRTFGTNQCCQCLTVPKYLL